MTHPSSSAAAAAVPAPYRDPARHLDSVLAPLERRTLLWLAARMPRFVHSDHLTALALFAMVAAGLSYWLAATHPIGLVLASVCLAINWFGDSLDGTLARVRQCQRPRYGYYVDHVVDEIGIACLLGGLAVSGYMSPWVAAAVLIAYFMLCIEVYLATHVLDTFRMTFFKMGPTELRIVLALGNTVALVRPVVSPFSEPLLLFDAGGIVAAIALLGTLVVSAAGNTLRLRRLEPLPDRPGQLR